MFAGVGSIATFPAEVNAGDRFILGLGDIENEQGKD